MAQHNCEDLKPTDAQSTVSTFTQASSDHTSNQICAHNPMAMKCNQSQYLTLVKQICAYNPSASKISQANLSNYFPISEQDFIKAINPVCLVVT